MLSIDGQTAAVLCDDDAERARPSGKEWVCGDTPVASAIIGRVNAIRADIDDARATNDQLRASDRWARADAHACAEAAIISENVARHCRDLVVEKTAALNAERELQAPFARRDESELLAHEARLVAKLRGGARERVEDRMAVCDGESYCCIAAEVCRGPDKINDRKLAALDNIDQALVTVRDSIRDDKATIARIRHELLWRGVARRADPPGRR
jgi:hypothetical protein